MPMAAHHPHHRDEMPKRPHYSLTLLLQAVGRPDPPLAQADLAGRSALRLLVNRWVRASRHLCCRVSLRPEVDDAGEQRSGDHSAHPQRDRPRGSLVSTEDNEHVANVGSPGPADGNGDPVPSLPESKVVDSPYGSYKKWCANE